MEHDRVIPKLHDDTPMRITVCCVTVVENTVKDSPLESLCGEGNHNNAPGGLQYRCWHQSVHASRRKNQAPAWGADPRPRHPCERMMRPHRRWCQHGFARSHPLARRGRRGRREASMWQRGIGYLPSPRRGNAGGGWEAGFSVISRHKVCSLFCLPRLKKTHRTSYSTYAAAKGKDWDRTKSKWMIENQKIKLQKKLMQYMKKATPFL
jgi:hypothetical protein